MSLNFQSLEYFNNNLDNIYHAIKKIDSYQNLFETFMNSKTFSYVLSGPWWDDKERTVKYSEEYFKGLYDMFITFNGHTNGMFFVGKESFEVSGDTNMITSSKQSVLSKKAREYFSAVPYDRLKLLLPIYFLFVAEKNAGEDFGKLNPEANTVQYLNLIVLLSKHLKIFDEEFKPKKVTRQRKSVDKKNSGFLGRMSKLGLFSTTPTIQFILIKGPLDVIPYHLDDFIIKNTRTFQNEYIVM